MIDFPAIWVWYGFLILGGLLLLVAVIQVINGLRHGSRMPLNMFVSAIFIFGIAALIMATMSFLNWVDWTSTFSLTLPSADSLKLNF